MENIYLVIHRIVFNEDKDDAHEIMEPIGYFTSKKEAEAYACQQSELVLGSDGDYDFTWGRFEVREVPLLTPETKALSLTITGLYLKERLPEIAKEAFELHDYCQGILSGGIDPPRILLSSTTRDDGAVELRWRNPELAGVGIVNPPYHVTDLEEHTDVYEIDGNTLKVNGNADVFQAKGYAETEKFCVDFYASWGIKCPFVPVWEQ